MGESIACLQVFIGFVKVIRDHETAGRDGSVAASSRHFFQNKNLTSGIVGGNSCRGAGSAETYHDDISFFVPLCIRGNAFSLSGSDGSYGSQSSDGSFEEHSFC